MPTRLIFNADDYGRTADISRGIRHAHTHGLVTSTTCMMNMPSVHQDIKIAQAETPRLGLGVHLVLTSGYPLLPAAELPGLTNADGSFLKLDALIPRAPQLDPAIVKAEWRAQVEAFIKTAGKKPSHLDSHHHSSYFTPGILQAMLELAREIGIPIRLPLAHGQDPYSAGIPEELAETMADSTPRILEKFQPASPDAFFASFYDEQATRAELMRIFRLLLPNGTFEIMCHPGYVDEAFARESVYAHQRQTELEILTDPNMRKEIDRLGIQLISFLDL